MTKHRYWIEAIRPKTLFAAVSPVLAGTGAAILQGSLRWHLFPLIITAAVLLQIGANLANDVLDHIMGSDTTERMGPRRMAASGLLSPWALMAATALALGSAAIIGVFLVYVGGWPILVIGMSSIIFAVLYSLGPWSLSRLGLGELFAFAYFGIIASGGTAALLSGRWSILGVVSGVVPGLMSTALLSVNNYRDREEDKLSGKKTLSVRLTKNAAKAEYPLLIGFALVAGAVIPLFIGSNLLYISVAPLMIPAMSIKEWFRIKEEKRRNRYLAITGITNLLYGVLFLGACLLQ